MPSGERIGRSRGRLEQYRPLRDHENLFGHFANVRQSPEAMLEFVGKFGPLTLEGMSKLRGEDIARTLEDARIMGDILRAAERRQFSVTRSKEPKSVCLNIRVGEPGSLEPLLKLEPRTLLDAIWLQLDHALSGDNVVRRCIHCQTWFPAGGDSGRRKDAKFCSDEHRVLYNSLKRTKVV